MAHRHTLRAKAGCQPLECGQVLDHDDVLGEAARLEGAQEPAEDDPQAQPCECIVLPDLLPERAWDTVLEAVEMTRGAGQGPGWQAWLDDMWQVTPLL